MNDIVEVDGFFHQVPKIRFVQKGKGVTNITGEKLYESQVIASQSRAETEFNLNSSFYMMLADEEKSVYRLVYEPKIDSLERVLASRKEFIEKVEENLKAINVEYEVKRKSGRLGDMELLVLRPGAFEEYKKHCLSGGQRESQFKIIALQYKKDVKFNFANCAVVESPGPSTEDARKVGGPRLAI